MDEPKGRLRNIHMTIKHHDSNTSPGFIALTEAGDGKTVTIKKFLGGQKLEHKLRQLGILPGDCVQILRRAPFDGPYLLRVRDREIALGVGVASKILVEENTCDLL